ncbi:zinc-dependent alcohol dehydrogenase family protein [Actinoplanes subtropicus]|uniref:zinc-dependent alcohol dehydrogenase family protein n=1 Tax=Actinoplanes subtropicus TaxID=543632 RepID=UPI0004C2F672|nr:zinc-dependent alcohol dehydrogenase family protein [Actinoplanes subtropicus]
MSEESSMQAAVLHKFGDRPQVTRVARPVAGPGEVLVRVAASGVNPLDAKIRAGAAGHAGVQVPAILGIDLSGTVAAVGDGVRSFAVGASVFGMTGGVGDVPGSLAEYAAVDARLLAVAPAAWSPRQAAAVPLAAITAWEGLVDRAAVGDGDLVLVQGGAGGVGHIAVQIAAARGARVFATGSVTDRELIASLGATFIDYRAEPPEHYLRDHTGGEGFDVVLDTIGGSVLDASFTVVRRYTGRVVSILGWGTHSLAPLSFRGASYSGVFTLLPLLTGEGRDHHGEVLRAIAALADEGRLTPVLDERTFTLATLDGAHDLVETGGGRGKVVVDVH